MADGILTPCNLACGSGIVTVNSPSGNTLQCDTLLWDDMPLNSPKRPPYWNSTSGFDFDYITAVDMSFCTSLRNFVQIGPSSAEKMTSCRFSRLRISAILDFRDSIMGSLKSPCTTSYRSSIETIALNCLVFLRKSRFCNLATDRQTNRWTAPMHEAALAVASGGLINDCARGITLLKLSTDGHKASRGLSATAELFVLRNAS